MNPRELVDHIRSGPVELVLDEPLRFRRRTRSNPCDFNEFLQALQSSETIRLADCLSHRSLEITEDEWVLLVKTLGSIRDIRILKLYCAHDSRDFCPFQAAAEAVNNAPSLRQLEIGLDGETVPRDPSGLIALANSLKEHTALQKFTLIDHCPQMEAAPRDLSHDLLLRALPACPHLREVVIATRLASADAMKTLLQLPKDTELVLETDHWLAVADEIRQGRCNIRRLYLEMYRTSSSSKTTEAVKAVASAIRLDYNLESLYLQMENDFTDEAGVALAEALTVNKTLRKITVFVPPSRQLQDADALRAPAYDAFSAMLRVNTSLVLKLPPFDDSVGDEMLVDSRNQMRIEQGLNHVGRGRLLSSSQTTRKEWVDALHELSCYCSVHETPEFNVSCLYSLVQLHPDVCMLQRYDTTNPGM
jgi:hypothetical protein